MQIWMCFLGSGVCESFPHKGGWHRVYLSGRFLRSAGRQPTRYCWSDRWLLQQRLHSGNMYSLQTLEYLYKHALTVIALLCHPWRVHLTYFTPLLHKSRNRLCESWLPVRSQCKLAHSFCVFVCVLTLFLEIRFHWCVLVCPPSSCSSCHRTG